MFLNKRFVLKLCLSCPELIKMAELIGERDQL